MFFRQTTSYMHAIFGSNSCNTDISKEKAEHYHFNISYVQLGPMKTAPLLDKYYWNEGLLNRQNLT